jgi:hypothetical protein
MKSPFVLIQDQVSNDTVECLEQLLHHARKGELIGIAYAAMLKRQGYIVNSAGEAHRNPTFARGMLRALDDRLGERIRGGNP